MTQTPSPAASTDGPIVLRDSTISDNSVAATATAGSANVDSGAGEINADATIGNTRFTGNSVAATSPAAEAHAGAGGIVTAAFDRMTISDSLISDNRLTATTTTGSSTVQGAGLANIGVLTLRNTSVSRNSGTASGPSGYDIGGGIFNASAPDGPPLTQLALVDSDVTHNVLTASPGITVQGGGVFTLFPLTQTDSVLADNVPDQCYGC